MKDKLKKVNKILLCCILGLIVLTGCDDETSQKAKEDRISQQEVAGRLSENQPTPTDIEYSLERYNLIKRAYWVNGMRDKANSLAAPIADMPLGYVVLMTESGDVIGQFTVDGKVTSLNSFLTPDSEYYEYGDYTGHNDWLADVDGSYGENDLGIFFFTTDGKYIEWDSHYLYSDIPFDVGKTVLKEK